MTILLRTTRALALAATAHLSFSMAAGADPQDYRVGIVNLDEATFEILQISESRNDEWGGNLLEAGPLPPDDHFIAEPDNLFGSCAYDIRVVDAMGIETMLTQIDLCEAIEIRLYSDWAEIDYVDGSTDALGAELELEELPEAELQGEDAIYVRY